MIVFVEGVVADFTETSVILMTQGLGYEIFMTGAAMSRLSVGQEVRIHTYFHVKEDGMQLYGFLNKDDRSVFTLLLGVNGIGPKAALGVLSGLTADELRFAVLSDDVKTLSRAPGIGKKTAQKLILELKDKLSLEEAFEQKLENQEAAASGDALGMDDAGKEAVEALAALGYSPTDAARAVSKVTDVDRSDVEALLKAALRNL